MKKSSLFFSLMAMGLTVAQAASVYTITLTTGERFTDCTVLYKSTDSTKFSGKNKAGKVVTKLVPQNSIINMREVVKEEEPAVETPAPAPTPETPKEPVADPAPAPAETAAPAAAEGEAPAPVVDGNIAQREGEDKAADATVRLRAKLASIDTELSKISKPSRALLSQTNSVKTRVTRQLADMDKRSLEIAKLQEAFNKAGAADFSFDKVSVDDRYRYMRDGEAAYTAMKIDMKEKKGRRKVGGLDKFEIMRERYQGIPEYKPAHDWYIKTLYDLQKKWTRMYDRETAARKRLAPDKRNSMTTLDERQYNELAAKLKEDGDEIASVWFVPQGRNLKMLSICVNKVKDAIRRNEREPLDAAVGTVPSLIEQFWSGMDKVRMAMVTGDLEGAEKQLNEIAAYNVIMSLKQHLLPNEYRTPIREQYRATQQEITKRIREYRRLKASLERSTAALDRITSNSEAQIDSALNAVQKELDADAGDNTMEVVPDKPEEEATSPAGQQAEQPAAEQQPAEQPAEAQ